MTHNVPLRSRLLVSGRDAPRRTFRMAEDATDSDDRVGVHADRIVSHSSVGSRERVRNLQRNVERASITTNR